jgi:hypothetical protein
VDHFIAYDGRKIRFTEIQRLHITFFHPEVMVDEHKIELALSEPELVATGATDDTRILYKFFAKTAVTSKYLAVVIKQLNGEGFILTAYFTVTVKRKVIWRKAS